MVCIRAVRIVRREGITIEEEIGKTAGAIRDALNTRSEQSLSELKIAVKGKEPTFDWAIGWLARENQIAITPEKRSFRIRLKQAQASAAPPRRLIVFPGENSSNACSRVLCCFRSHASLLFLCAGMPVRIAEVCLAEPAITPFAIFGGDNHARLIPGRNVLAELCLLKTSNCLSR